MFKIYIKLILYSNSISQEDQEIITYKTNLITDILEFLEICIIILPETNSEFKIQPHMREILKFTSICLNTCYSPSLENVRITLEIMIFVVAKFPQLKQELNLDLYNQLITYLRDNNYQDVAEEALITIRNH